MTIRAIVWDIGGVLVRTEDRTPRLRLAESLGLTYAQLEDTVFNADLGLMAQVGQVTTDEVWRWVADILRQPREMIPTLMHDFFAGDVLDTELVDEIRALHGQYRTGIITNAFESARRLIEEVWQIQDAFDHIVISAEVGVMKPDPRIFQIALQGLEVEAFQAVFVDDFQHNVQGAKHIGMHAIHFRKREQALQELRALLDGGNPSH
jgi:glucose-1-phosphatase